ncbi:hypothetical protein Ga0080574_TMP926 [Salipiger abyssi]|uniref:Uncharacterized protein n=1 Tax=Salipiger abyssi TaxID=1250539 RepID=A0A1P8UPD6_9RHOB|nr:hypothetical protein Ga0080574_TMP926 [Salipiger abyssi]
MENPGEGEEVGDHEFLNDATLIGTECPEFEAMLEQEATFLTGKVYPDKPHKSTQAGQWKPVKMKFIQHIIGFEATSNSPAYGLSRHPVGKTKDGLSFVMGSSIGGQRKAKAMDTMYAIGLDIDSGATLETVRAKILKMGVACFLYTSWNHGKSGVTLKRDDVLKKLEIDGDPTLEQVHDYLRHHGKNRFEEGFIKRVTIAKQKVQEEDGVKIVLDTPPIDKLRLIFPLAEPVKIIELSERHDDALAIWEDKITGLAQKELGIHFDTSCTDPSRLFYTARHDQKSKDWVCEIVQGKPLVFDEIRSMRKSLYTRNRDLNPFVEADDFSQGGQVPNIFLPSGRSLNDWHSKYGKSRFQIADMLQTGCPERIRVSGGEASGSVHTECPFEHLHTKEGGTATMATNALDSQSGYWTWFCHHDACQDRHKLEFLGEAIKEGWFPEEVLFSDDYLLPAEEEVVEDDPEDYKPSEDPETPPEPKTPLELAQKITAESSDEDVQKLFKRLIRRKVGEMDKENVITDIAKRTPLGKKTLNKWWREIVKVHKEKQAEKDLDPDALMRVGDLMDVNNDLPVLVQHAKAGIIAANTSEAQFFHFIDAPAFVRPDASGRQKIHAITTQRAMRAKMDDMARFGKRTAGEDSSLRHVLTPADVADKVLFDDLSFLPPLTSVTSTPFFAADGTLIDRDGYHFASATMLRLPSGFEMPSVAEKPTEEDVLEAKRLLVEEAYGDFPVSGVSRNDLVAEARGEEAMTEVEAAGLSHLIAATLLPFCRNMIDGPTPGHLLNKPAPGTGASLLTDTLSIVATGTPSPAQTFPANREEVGKTITATLMAGNPIVYFDNISHELDTGELASAMTAPTYSARILGESAMVETEVRCMWLLTGNKVKMSGELARRCILIPLDAKTSEPDKRTGWRHKDIRGWVKARRGQFVWACLTLIQNWIAKGKKPCDTELASYDRWSEVMGGILREAGLRGFLANNDLLREAVKSGLQEGVRDLLDLLASLPDGSVIRLGGWAKPRCYKDEERIVVSLMHLLNRDPDFNAKLPKALHAEASAEKIIVAGWGYNLQAEEYKTANKIGVEWRALADQPQEGFCAEAEAVVPLRFEAKKDERGKDYWLLRRE